MARASTRTCMSFSALQRAEIAEIPPILARRGTLFRVSVLFNEPKLLKSRRTPDTPARRLGSGLFNEPKLLKLRSIVPTHARTLVSVLFNEPKLLKYCVCGSPRC